MVVLRNTPTIPAGAPDATFLIDTQTVGDAGLITGINPDPALENLSALLVVIIGADHFVGRIGEVHRLAVRVSPDAILHKMKIVMLLRARRAR